MSLHPPPLIWLLLSSGSSPTSPITHLMSLLSSLSVPHPLGYSPLCHLPPTFHHYTFMSSFLLLIFFFLSSHPPPLPWEITCCRLVVGEEAQRKSLRSAQTVHILLLCADNISLISKTGETAEGLTLFTTGGSTQGGRTQSWPWK